MITRRITPPASCIRLPKVGLFDPSEIYLYLHMSRRPRFKVPTYSEPPDEVDSIFEIHLDPTNLYNLLGFLRVLLMSLDAKNVDFFSALDNVHLPL